MTTQYTDGILQSQATYVDINNRFGVEGAADVVLDIKAINVGIQNLLSTPIGSCGPIFNPKYGSLLLELIGEPIDDQTAYKIQSCLIQAIETWETRIQLDMTATSVIPDYQILGYRITIAYRLIATNLRGSVSFSVTAPN